MKIKTLEKIRVPAGVRLLLTDEQLDARRHNVAVDDDGVVLVNRPIEFKGGEVLDVIGELPIVIPADHYESLDEKDVKKAKKMKAGSDSTPSK